jgi:hypothetical protein
MRNLKKGEKVEVLWKDTITEGQGWSKFEDYPFDEAVKGSTFSTMGRVLRRYKSHLFVAQNYREVDGSFSTVTAIPIATVVKVKKVK